MRQTIDLGGIRTSLPMDVTLLDYNDAEDYGKLWSEQLFAESKDRNRTFAVYWNPEGDKFSNHVHDRLLSTHLTPIDWALGFSSAHARRDGVAQSVRINIVIDGDWSDDTGWSHLLCVQLVASMPWVTLFADQNACRINAGSLIRPIEVNSSFINRSAASLNCGDASALERLARLSSLWAVASSLENDYHDVNNIVGAHVLVSALQSRDIGTTGALSPKRKASPFVKAFVTKLTWCNLLPELAQASGAISSLRWELRRARDVAGGKLNVVVIDDMLYRGWGEALRRLFDLKTPQSTVGQVSPESPTSEKELMLIGTSEDDAIRLFGIDSASVLVRFLKDADYQKRSFSRRLCGQENPGSAVCSEIVLLDLRVFDQSSQPDFELGVRELWHAVRTKVCTQTGLAWQSLAEDAAEIDAWASNLPGGQIPAAVLTLLPRLLALADPLLPIIVFSSTGRTGVKEKLKPYRNVVTKFEKPRLVAEKASLEASIFELGQSIAHGYPLLQASNALAGLQIYSQNKEHNQAYNPPPALTSNKRYFEIYFDESGTLKQKNLVCTATVLMFPDESGGSNLQQSLEQAVEAAQVDEQYGQDGAISPSWVYWGYQKLPSYRLRKFDPAKPVPQFTEHLKVGCSRIAYLFEKSSVHAFRASLGQVGCGIISSRLDSEYDRMLGIMTEFLVNVFLPIHAGKDFSWRVYFPTRMQEISDLGAGREMEMEWGTKFLGGFTKNGSTEYFCETCSVNGFYPFLREFERRWYGAGPQLLSGRGLPLNEFSYSKNIGTKDDVLKLWPRWIAGLADWTAFVAKSGNKPWKSVLDNLVVDTKIRGNVVGGVESCEWLMESVRNAIVPTGSSTEMMFAFLRGWNLATGGSAEVFKLRHDQSPMFYAICTRLLPFLQEVGGEALFAATSRLNADQSGLSAGWSGAAVVIDRFDFEGDLPRSLYLMKIELGGGQEHVLVELAGVQGQLKLETQVALKLTRWIERRRVGDRGEVSVFDGACESVAADQIQPESLSEVIEADSALAISQAVAGEALSHPQTPSLDADIVRISLTADSPSGGALVTSSLDTVVVDFAALEILQSRDRLRGQLPVGIDRRTGTSYAIKSGMELEVGSVVTCEVRSGPRGEVAGGKMLPLAVVPYFSVSPTHDEQSALMIQSPAE